MAYNPPGGQYANFELRLYVPPNGDMANFAVNTFLPPIWILGSEVRMKINKKNAPMLWDFRGIYQMRMTKKGKVPIRMRFYEPTDPKTPAQQETRTNFQLAMMGWQSLTPEEKAVYTERAKPLQMFGHNLYISEFIKSLT